ncbi:MAG: lipid-A-disaccharide synthase [Taibaiella sp.]|nr:lipid-A-disaccharide synthase [Taibaiella sp.]
MRYYIIAGEASGDLHGSNLIKELHLQDERADVRCWGGDKMEAAGAVLVKHYRKLAFMGFVEVIKHLPAILKNISFCKQDILQYMPDCLVLIDYPGFNLRIAEWARQQNIKVIYYISPQVWAWKEKRVIKIKRDVDKMLVILPFEEEFYEKWNYSVTYVGHPLTDVVAAEQLIPARPIAKRPVIALLPGSRAQEIKAKLPVMLQMIKHFPAYEFVIAQASSLPESLYTGLMQGAQVTMVKGDTYNLLKQATAALVTSGTATLETALFGVPEVVCYRGNPISYWLAKKLVSIKYISLVNLIMDAPVIKELIQGELTETNLKAELELLLHDNTCRQRLKASYASLWRMLGERPASRLAAREIINALC